MRLGSNPAILASGIVTLDYASSSTLSTPFSLIFSYRLMRCIWFLSRAMTTRTHHPWCSSTYWTSYASYPRGQYNHLRVQPESPILSREGAITLTAPNDQELQVLTLSSPNYSPNQTKTEYLPVRLWTTTLYGDINTMARFLLNISPFYYRGQAALRWYLNRMVYNSACLEGSYAPHAEAIQ